MCKQEGDLGNGPPSHGPVRGEKGRRVCRNGLCVGEILEIVSAEQVVGEIAKGAHGRQCHDQDIGGKDETAGFERQHSISLTGSGGGAVAVARIWPLSAIMA